MSQPSSLHQQAAALRESGQSAQALATYEQALIDYLTSDQHELIINVLLEKVIVYKHIWQRKNQTWYLDLTELTLALAKKWAATVPITLEQQALVSFQGGEVALLQNDTALALREYQSALDVLPNDHAYRGNCLYHLGFAQALAGQAEQGLAQIHRGIEHLTAAKGLEEHTKRVWLSGAWLRLASVQAWRGKTTEALEAYQQAETIVISEPLLVVRQQQMEKVKKLMSQSSFDLREVL
jgi:tetratricopeptide (TPR) repeat protein